MDWIKQAEIIKQEAIKAVKNGTATWGQQLIVGSILDKQQPKAEQSDE